MKPIKCIRCRGELLEGEFIIGEDKLISFRCYDMGVCADEGTKPNWERYTVEKVHKEKGDKVD